MRFLEISILMCIILPVIQNIIFQKNKIPLTLIITGLGLFLTFLNWMVNGFYFQLLPAGILLIWLFLRSILFYKKSKNIIISSWIGKVIFILTFLVAWILPFLFPLCKLPVPSGEFPVGVTRFYVVDSTRQEKVTLDTTDLRELTVTVWYPAKIKGNEKRAPYLKNAGEILATGIAGLSGSEEPSGLVRSFFSYLEKIKTHSYEGAAISDNISKYPVLIFNHGLYGYSGQNTLQMEHLASNGYVVFSINHTYYAMAVHFQDNRTVAAKNFRPETSSRTNALELINDLLEETELTNFENKLMNYFKSYPNSNDVLKYWRDDISSLINYLEKINRNHTLHQFHNKLDLEQIGVFGMSIGGGAAVEYSLNNARCKACASLDGIYFADSLNVHLDVPFMVMERDFQYSYQLLKNQYTFNDFLIKRSTNPTYKLSIEKSAHFNYTDANYLFPAFRFIGTYVLGKAERNEMNEMMNTYLLTFFNRYLLRKQEYELNKKDVSGKNELNK